MLIPLEIMESTVVADGHNSKAYSMATHTHTHHHQRVQRAPIFSLFAIPTEKSSSRCSIDTVLLFQVVENRRLLRLLQGARYSTVSFLPSFRVRKFLLV